MAAGAGFVQNFVLWKEAGYFDTTSELKPLMHLWSLAIEEQFYLIYPVLIWAAWRAGLNVLTVVIVLALISFGLNIHWIEKDAVKTFFVPQTRFWELLAGSVLAYLQFFKPKAIGDWLSRRVFHRVIFKHPPVSAEQGAALVQLTSVLGLLLIVLAVFALHKGTPFPGWWALAPVIGAALLIFSGPNAWVNQKILGNRLMVFVGTISYPLYLWHWSILSFARIIESEMPARKTRIAAVALSFFFAWLTYQLVERPIRFGRKTWFKTAAASCLLILIAYIGYNSFDRNGLPFRTKQFESNLRQFNWDESLNRETTCQNEISLSKERLPNTYCRGKLKSADVLLIGDSHSNALAAGLMELFPHRILNLAGGGCIPFWGVDSGNKGQSPQCPSEDSEIFLNIAENTASLSTVIISLRGPFYIEGTGFGPIEADANRYIRWSETSDVGGYAEIYEKSMRTTLTRLLAKQKRVIFVIDVPELGFDPKTCVDSRPLSLSAHKKQPCAVPRKAFDDRNRKYRILVASVLKDFPEVKVFDASDAFCDSIGCWAMRDGKMLFRDDDHLSMQGSRYVAARLAALLGERGSQ